MKPSRLLLSRDHAGSVEQMGVLPSSEGQIRRGAEHRCIWTVKDTNPAIFTRFPCST